MAARLNNRLSEAHRKAIKTSMLLKRLQDHAVGKVDLSSAQVGSIKILLGKAMPDLKQLDIQGEIDHKHTVKRIDLSGNSE